jgi:hypothetical protein
MLQTPILFLIFNRPDLTQKVFDSIRQARPTRLFVAADGPRENKEGEEFLCQETRKIVDLIDWDCEVHTLFRDKNLGCKKAVAQAISWFFENVEEGIILEDDCLPVQSFYLYCEKMLEKYRYENKIMCISGETQLEDNSIKESCYYTNIPDIWGWATWKRAWALYDIEMKDYPESKKKEFLDKIFSNKYHKQDWIVIFDKMYANQIDTWDYIWCYTMFKNDGLCVIPKVNMIKNIGFDERATHTLNENSLWANKETGEMVSDLIFPEKLELSPKRQDLILRERFGMSGKFSLSRYHFYCKVIRELGRIKEQLFKRDRV